MSVRKVSLADLPAGLVERFADGDGFLLIGAGVSREAVEARDGLSVTVGVPLAAKLAAHLKKRIRPPYPAAETLESLATLYAVQHSRERLNKLIQRVYGRTGSAAPAFFGLLGSLPPEVRTFATTNYERFVEGSLAPRNPVITVRDHGMERVTEARPVVHKLHGDARTPNECVITTQDYDAWTTHPGPLIAQLSTLFLQRTPVAIGYKAQDSNLRQVISTVHSWLRARGERPHDMYVVIPNPEPNDFAPFDSGDFDLILVNATGEEFIEWLDQKIRSLLTAREADDLAHLLDPEPIRLATAEVIRTAPAVAADQHPAAEVPNPVWLPHARANLALAAVEEAAGRDAQACTSKARAARGFILGGDAARGHALLRETLQRAFVERRDVELLHRAIMLATQTDRGVGLLPMPEDDDSKMLVALAEVFQGLPGDPPTFIGELEARSAADPTNHPLTGRLEQLRAETAVTALDFGNASSHFALASENADNAASRADLRVRSLFFGGLTPELSSQRRALDELRTLAVPPQAEQLRLRAVGWLATLCEDFEDARLSFHAAAQMAVRNLDVVGAVAGYRGDVWASRHQPGLAFALESSSAGFRLAESLHAQRPRETVDRLLDRARNALHDRKYREAAFAAGAAQRLAYDDIDPAGVFESQSVLAETWIGVIASPDVVDDSSFVSATYYAASARLHLSEEIVTPLVETLRGALKSRVTADTRKRIFHVIATEMVERESRAGSLRLLADLAELIDNEVLDADVVPALCRAFAENWHFSRTQNVVLAACELLGTVYTRLSPASAAELEIVLVALIEKTPANRLDDIYLALAQTIDRAALPADGGEQLSQFLVDKLQAARTSASAIHIGHVAISIAALAAKTSGGLLDRLQQTLTDESAAHRWDGLAILASLGGSVQREVLDAYLMLQIQTMHNLTVREPPNTFGWGTTPSHHPLTRAAAKDATPELRRDAISRSVALLAEDGQWPMKRAPWVPFLVLLLRESPDQICEGLPTLHRLASGNFGSPGNVEETLSNHPLSAMRWNFGDAGNLQTVALHGLGLLWSRVEGVERDGVHATISAGAHDAKPQVRRAAMIAVGQALHDAAIVSGGISNVESAEDARLVHLARQGLGDSAAEVREAAREALAPPTETI